MALISNTVTSTQRTAYGIDLALAKYLDTAYTVMPNTTINEELAIQATSTLPDGKYPSLGYLAIGIGGHGTGILNGTPYLTERQHQSDHPRLKEMIPLVLRLTNNDIPASERAKYRLRKVESHGGNTYYAYYMKDIKSSIGAIIRERITTSTDSNGVVTPVSTQTFSMVGVDAAALPMLEITGNNQVIAAGNQAISVSSLLTIGFTVSEIAEILNAVEIIKGSKVLAVMSEIAICSGFDKVITVPTTGTTAGSTVNVQFTEVTCAQINYFEATQVALNKISENFSFTVNIGNAAPINVVATT